jgi:hypothetical protein
MKMRLLMQTKTLKFVLPVVLYWLGIFLLNSVFTKHPVLHL